MDSKKDNIVASAAHYAMYLGIFWGFKYIFLITSEFAGDLYLYIYNLLAIGTPVLFYALTAVYRDKRLDGIISFGTVVKFAALLFFFASLIECLVVALHIMIIDPGYLSNLQDQLYQAFQNAKLSPRIMASLEEGLNFGPGLFMFAQIISNIIFGLIISVIFGYFLSSNKKEVK